MSLHELTDEQREIRDLARRFADEEVAPHAAAWDREHRFPRETLGHLGELGLMGVCVPEAHAGAGADFLSYCLVLEELSRANTTNEWACEPFVHHCFVPVMRPSASARVRIAPASEPESGSVSAKAAISWPCASGGTSRSICSGVPCWRIGSVPALVCTATVTPSPASARESSSSTRQ
jgi:alkylation response protein AidB-like acyl-CoA dehydrogenase